MKLTKKIEERIISLNKKGVTNRAIAKKFDTHHNNISDILNKYGLKSKWCNQKINIVSKNKAKCSRCDKIKDISEFQHGRKGQKYEYKFSYCNYCRRTQTYRNMNSTVEKYLKNNYNRSKRRAKVNNIKFEISWEEYIKQYEKQKGKCFYTDQIMSWGVGSGLKSDSVSLDKIIPDKGYVLGNCVFCSRRINSIKLDVSLFEMKEWMPRWYQKVKQHFKENKDICDVGEGIEF